MNNNLTVSFDIGIGSVGWAVVDPDHAKLIEFGSHVFNEATSAQQARGFRSARRTQRRRKWREKQLLMAFVDFGLVTEDELKQEGYLSYTTNNDLIKRPKEETVYHLRNKALDNPVSTRELILCLYNICKTRGHFLLENVNFERDTVTFDLFKEKFYALTNDYFTFSSIEGKEEFEKEVLKEIYNKKLKSNEIKSKLKKMDCVETEEMDAALLEICKLIAGYKGELTKISESVVLPESATNVKVQELLKKDSLNDFLEGIIELYDLINIAAILKKYNYICQLNVAELDNVKEVYKLENTDNEEYDKKKKEIQAKMSSTGVNGNRLRVVKNMENKFPNGLYLKEAKRILETQQRYNPKITNAFIEVCLGIIKTRIPYYIGPLDESAKNAWLTKNHAFKYSYDYSTKELHAVDEEASIKKWKYQMISRCTYLPNEFALPKGSLLAEVFSIVNEMNILTAKDTDGNTYYLTMKDKIHIFDELFLKKKEIIKYDEVKDLLNLQSFGPKNGGFGKNFKNSLTLYHPIVSLLPELRLKSILDVFAEENKIKQLEDIILSINLFDEESSKKQYFIKQGYQEDVSSKLSKLSSKKFYAFSKAFICDTPMDQENHSLLELLFEDNTAEFVNEQMTRIHSATDVYGNKIDFDANKYKAKLKENKELSIDLLMDDGKPFMPISRPVIRSLNECMKVYKEIISIYGVPKRVVIETARDLKDSSRKGEVPAKHFDQMKSAYDYLKKQIKEQKSNHLFKGNEMVDWEEIETYLSRNKRKIELYIRQNGLDMISGERIDINRLDNYEMDHILPRGFGDNSMDNMMLISKSLNAAKSNRVPLEFIESGEALNSDEQFITSSSFVRRVNSLFELKMISEKKKDRLLLKSSKDVEGFINRNLVDTRYIIKEFMAILNAYHDVNHYDTHVVALKSAFTDTYRKNGFHMPKNRDVGVQHHAHDAAILAIVDKMLLTYYPNYDSRGNMKAYHNFLLNLNKNEKNQAEKDFGGFTWIMYQKAFHERLNDQDSLLSQVKSRVPLFSVKAEKNYKGQFFDATIYPQKDKKTKKETKKGILGEFGINNDKHIFSAINCVAVDFYKYTNKRGKKKHLGVHIPKVIIDDQGRIDQDKYKFLVKEYYKVPELFDENGNIIQGYFRFRAFKNDLIYDSVNNELQMFNIGSIANKKLEMKHINIFSYDDISAQVRESFYPIVDEFNIRIGRNKSSNAIPFSEVNKDELITYCMDNLMAINDVDRYGKAIRDNLKKCLSFNNFLETMAFFNLIINRECTPPTIVGQFMPVADRFKSDEDGQYFKVKASILGVRFHKNEDGKLVISGPNRAANKFSKIRKEDFSWRICRDMIE